MNAMGRAAGREAAATGEEQAAAGAESSERADAPRAIRAVPMGDRADATHGGDRAQFSAGNSPTTDRASDAAPGALTDKAENGTAGWGSPHRSHADDAPPTPRAAPVPVIATERLRLRPLAPPDAGLLTVYSGDPRVAKGTRSVPHPLPPGTAEGYIARANAARRVEEVWALDASHHGLDALLGVISLRPLGNAQSEISYWVAPAFWNTGYASEAVRALVAANPLGDSSFFAAVFQDNPASARVLTNAGFDYLGDAEAFSVARDAMVRTWTYIRKLTPG